jgi:hypothetical protein
VFVEHCKPGNPVMVDIVLADYSPYKADDEGYQLVAVSIQVKKWGEVEADDGQIRRRRGGSSSSEVTGG